MNCKSIYMGLTVLPLLAGIAHADESLVGHYRTTGKAEVAITLNDGTGSPPGQGKYQGWVKLPDGAEYSLRQVQPTEEGSRYFEAEGGFKWVFVIQPKVHAKGTAKAFNVFRRNPKGTRNEAVRLLCLNRDPRREGRLNGKIIARTKSEGPTRAGIPFTPIIWFAEPSKPAKAVARHFVSLRKVDPTTASTGTGTANPNGPKRGIVGALGEPGKKK